MCKVIENNPLHELEYLKTNNSSINLIKNKCTSYFIQYFRIKFKFIHSR